MEKQYTLEDLAVMCRLCMRQQTGMHDLYAEDEQEENKSLAFLITWLTQIQLNANDGLPAAACSQCVLQLNGALQFVDQCIATDQRLREIAAQLYQPEGVEEDEQDREESGDVILREVIIPVEMDPLAETAVHLFKAEEMEVVVKDEGEGEGGVVVYIEAGYGAGNAEPIAGAELCETEQPASSQTASPSKDAARSQRRPRKLATGSKLKGKFVAAKRSYPRTNAFHAFECNICSIPFETKPALADHMDSTHKTPGKKSHQCPSCLHIYPNLGQLEKHLIVLTGGRPFTCELCDSYFSRADSLKKHVRIHTGETPYQCSVCPRAFKHPWSLVTHKRTHTGERPHKCDVCGRGFCDRKAVRKHRCMGVSNAMIKVEEVVVEMLEEESVEMPEEETVEAPEEETVVAPEEELVEVPDEAPEEVPVLAASVEQTVKGCRISPRLPRKSAVVSTAAPV